MRQLNLIKMAQCSSWHGGIRVVIHFAVFVAIFMCFTDFSQFSLPFLDFGKLGEECASSQPTWYLDLCALRLGTCLKGSLFQKGDHDEQKEGRVDKLSLGTKMSSSSHDKLPTPSAVYVYVCVCVYVYVYICLCMCAHVYTHVHTCRPWWDMWSRSWPLTNFN